MTTPVERGKLLRISSQDGGAADTNAKFNITLNNAPFIQSCRGVVINSVSFKHVFPNIFSGNNTFRFIYDGNPLECVLPPAWYTLDDFPATLGVAISAAAGDTVTVVSTTIPAGASGENKKLVFTASAGHTIGLLAEPTNPMASVVGIAADIPEALSVTPQWLADLSGLSQVYLQCAQIAAQHSTASSENAQAIPICISIPIMVPFGGQVYYKSNDAALDSIIFPNDRSLTRMDFSLNSRAGRVLDLQQHQLVITMKTIPGEFYAHD